jgi:hypothetical protein
VFAGTPTETLTAFKKAAKAKDLEATWKHAAKFKGLPDQVNEQLKGEVQDFIDLRARGWDFEIMEEKIDDDCAVIIINESKKEGRKSFDIDPVYLIKQDGAWMVFPHLTNWEIAEQVAKDKVESYKKLEEWYKTRKAVIKKTQG